MATPSTKRASGVERRAPGDAVERLHERGAGPGLGQRPAELAAELAVASAVHALERADRPLAGGDGEREQLGDGRELLEHPLLALR